MVWGYIPFQKKLKLLSHHHDISFTLSALIQLFNYSNPKPNDPNSMCNTFVSASLNLSRPISSALPKELKLGRSNRLKQVCALGKMEVDNDTLSIVNNRTLPSLPCNPAKPDTGTREDPVTNCSSRHRVSSSYSSTHSQNQRTTG